MTSNQNNNLDGYPALKVYIKNGSEHFFRNGQLLTTTLLDFWRWSASDLVNNALRGQLAEYIVAQALGTTHTLRVEWDSYDLITSNGIRIEVKSAAYIQSWYHKKLSSISFSIRPTIGWNAATNTYGSELKRQSDLYVFCLLSHQDKDSIDPLNLDQWEFFVLPTSILNQVCTTQKTITLRRLQQLSAKHVTFDDLASTINSFPIH
jgi:hypothetical protein